MKGVLWWAGILQSDWSEETTLGRNLVLVQVGLCVRGREGGREEGRERGREGGREGDACIIIIHGDLITPTRLRP